MAPPFISQGEREEFTIALASVFSMIAAIVLSAFNFPSVRISGCFQLVTFLLPAESAPSTGIAAPVMYRDISLARKSAR